MDAPAAGLLELPVEPAGPAEPADAPPATLERVDDPSILRDVWSALACAERNVFATYEWASTWWAHVGRGRPVTIAVRDRSDATIAVVPLEVTRRGPLRIARFVGHGVGDELGPVCAPADRPRAADALGRIAGAADAPWDVLLAERLPGETDWAGPLGGRELKREASPVMHLDAASWHGVLAGMRGTLRRDLARKARRVEAAHRVTYRETSDPHELERDLDTLFALHAARWPDGDSSFTPREAFHRAFAPLALERGWLRLCFLELDGRPAAALYDFRMGDAQLHYNGGRDPAFGDLSVGLVLRMRALEAAVEAGVREYRFLRGDEPYKFRLADTDHGVLTAAHGRGPLGRAAVAAAGLAIGQTPLRRVLRRFT